MKVDNEVLSVLSKADINGNELRLTGQLDRKLYDRTNKVLDAAGGKWNRKAKAHVFESDAFNRIDEIILSGEVEIPKDEFNYFPSPPAVVDRLIEIAEIEQGMKVLEPSAGRGAIAFACVDKGATADCIELMEENYNALRDDSRLSNVVNRCFLDIEPLPIYDRVIMNPPFAKQQDINHVTHALKFLRPGGKLVSVMSASVTFRENNLTKEFISLVADRGGRIELLPDGAFKESGTMVRTVIVEIPSL